MRPAKPITVRTTTLPRPGGRTRTLVRLDRKSELHYEQTVAPVAGAIEHALGPPALAVRARRVDSSRSAARIELAPWRPARRRLHLLVDRFAASSEALAITDIRACYASIGNRALASRLRELGCRRRDVDAILRLLDGFHEAGVPGLPVGPVSSAVLANAVLSAVDEAVAAPGVRHLRWVDDVLVFARDERRARLALDRAGNVLAGLDLRLAADKTRVLDPRQTQRPALHGVSMSRACLGRPL